MTRGYTCFRRVFETMPGKPARSMEVNVGAAPGSTPGASTVVFSQKHLFSPFIRLGIRLAAVTGSGRRAVQQADGFHVGARA